MISLCLHIWSVCVRLRSSWRIVRSGEHMMDVSPDAQYIYSTSTVGPQQQVICVTELFLHFSHCEMTHSQRIVLAVTLLLGSLGVAYYGIDSHIAALFLSEALTRTWLDENATSLLFASGFPRWKNVASSRNTEFHPTFPTWDSERGFFQGEQRRTWVI